MMAFCNAGLKCFNSRAREGRDAKGIDDIVLLRPFQFTRPRGATQSSIRLRHRYRFNSRAREGRAQRCPPSPPSSKDSTRPRARLQVLEKGDQARMFQFTRPRGARRRCARWKAKKAGFNSRAREGRDRGFVQRWGRRRVSIHAPARGATTLTWARDLGQLSFNSRAREGRDFSPPRFQRRFPVSIHAPARGATCAATRSADGA